MTANAFGDRLGLHRDYLCLPQWIYGAVPLDPEDIYEGRSYHRRRDLRLVRENNLEYSIVADEAALNDWYETMYTPLIRASHGAGALLMSRDAMLRQAADGECELVLISREGKALGGSLLVYDEAGAKVLSRGILDANRDYQRQGVGAAIYLFSFDYLYKKGFKSVDIGRVRPFLGDGGLHFKKKNGFCLTGHSGRGFLLKSCRASPAADEFFIENPLVHIAANGLRGLLAFPEGTLVDDKKFRKKLSYHELPGLEQLDIIELGADNVVGRTSIERARPLVA